MTMLFPYFSMPPVMPSNPEGFDPITELLRLRERTHRRCHRDLGISSNQQLRGEGRDVVRNSDLPERQHITGLAMWWSTS